MLQLCLTADVLPLQVNQTDAEANCNRYGGHLAAYTSIEEQVRLGSTGWGRGVQPCTS